jgi:hypothetical protein
VSTQINVTVGSGGLSDKAKQLQTAARQAQLEKERQQRIEAQGQEQRNAKLEAEGKAPDGSLLYGPGFKQPEIERRPAAFRVGNQAGISFAWEEITTETVTSITYANSTKSLCGVPAVTLGYSSNFNAYRVISGNGSQTYSFAIDLSDISLDQNFSPPNLNVFGVSFQDYAISIGWDYSALYSYLISPANVLSVPVSQITNPNNQIVTGWLVILPVGPNKLIYYFYSRYQVVSQMLSQQIIRDCSTGSRLIHYWGDTAPEYSESVSEHCLLVTSDAIKSIAAPAGLRNKMLATLPTYSYQDVAREIGIGNYYNGERSDTTEDRIYIDTWLWDIAPATAPISFSLDPLLTKYTATAPVIPSRVFTANRYQELAVDPNTDYVKYRTAAPSVTNRNTEQGFDASKSIDTMYATATSFQHSAFVDQSPRKANAINMSPNRVSTSPGIALYIGYDWGAPRFCVDQLKKLGFSDADLTP